MSNNPFIRYSSNYVAGLTRMASSCSRIMGPSYVDAGCYELGDYKKEFANSYKIKEEDINLIEVNKSFRQFLEDIFGNDVPGLVDGLEHWIHMEAGDSVKIWNTADDSELEEKLGGESGGRSSFYFVEDIFFIEFEKMVICFMIGNDE